MATRNRVEKEIKPTEATDWNNPRSRANLVFRASIGELARAHPSHKKYLDKAMAFFETKLQAAKELHDKLNASKDFFEWRDYVKENPPDADVLGYLLTVAESHRQSIKASKPRIRNTPHRDVCIDAMRSWRIHEKGTLKDFVAAAMNDSIDGLTIRANRDSYEIDIYSGDLLEDIEPVTVSFRTLERWFTEK